MAREDLAEAVTKDHQADADLVGLSAFEVEEEEETDHGWEESSDLEGQNNLLGVVVRRAFLESLDLEEMRLVVDHSRDHIEDSSFEIVVAVDVEDVVESGVVGMVADCGVEGLVVIAG